MEGWTWWDLGLWAAFGYVAWVALVRLMLARRDRLLADLRRQFDEEKRRGKKKRPKAKDGRSAA